MELTILGSGTYQPELKRHSSSYLLKIGKQNLVFDFGRGVIDQLLKLNIRYYDIDAIFISHTHPDHCSELSSFLHVALAEPYKEKFRKKDITIYGPKGIKKTIRHILYAFGLQKLNPPYKVLVKELKNNDSVKGENWILKSYTVKHSKVHKSLSYRLLAGNKMFAYSGDTIDCPGLRKCIHNANLAVVEASWPKGLRPETHLSAEDTGKITQESGIKKLIVTHVAPYYLKNFNVINEVKRFYKNPVIIAKDLMKIKI